MLPYRAFAAFVVFRILSVTCSLMRAQDHRARVSSASTPKINISAEGSAFLFDWRQFYEYATLSLE